MGTPQPRDVGYRHGGEALRWLSRPLATWLPHTPPARTSILTRVAPTLTGSTTTITMRRLLDVDLPMIRVGLQLHRSIG
ncbi:hypothetical protein L6452_25878 [Arctium lappa]|uniref:Uncharacterized protein n=1 Tax=Arctium lappa TaxID=4217 RepID=A0ACB9AC29_ARCLA|nr:hypothetical protein L6452_25878 [Arctium lappa]